MQKNSRSNNKPSRLSGKAIRVLVTGVGGNIGQGIMKAVRMSKLNIRMIGTDMNPLSAGLMLCDRGYVVKSSSDPGFFRQIAEILRKEKVQILFVGSDEEIDFFSKNRLRLQSATGTFILVSGESISRFGYDKWHTYHFCKEHGIPYPRTFLPSQKKELKSFISSNGYRLLVKPRVGYGSRDIYRVSNQQELSVFLKRVKNPIIQEYIGDDSEEYTASSFMTEKGRIVGTILFRRYLSAGATYKAEVVKDRDIQNTVEGIVRKIAPLGPCNVQFRKIGRRLIPFEFNIRFSGTTPIRSILGFNDVDWAIRHFLLRQPLSRPKIAQAVAFRYWNEIIASRESFSNLKQKKKHRLRPSRVRILDVL